MSHMVCANVKMNNRKYFKELSSVMSPYEDGYINKEKKEGENMININISILIGWHDGVPELLNRFTLVISRANTNQVNHFYKCLCSKTLQSIKKFAFKIFPRYKWEIWLSCENKSEFCEAIFMGFLVRETWKLVWLPIRLNLKRLKTWTRAWEV